MVLERIYHNFKNLARRVVADVRFGDKAQKALWIEDSFLVHMPIWDRYKIHKKNMKSLANYLKNINVKNFEKVKKSSHILLICSPTFHDLENFPITKWATSRPYDHACSIETCSW